MESIVKTFIIMLLVFNTELGDEARMPILSFWSPSSLEFKRKDNIHQQRDSKTAETDFSIKIKNLI